MENRVATELAHRDTACQHDRASGARAGQPRARRRRRHTLLAIRPVRQHGRRSRHAGLVAVGQSLLLQRQHGFSVADTKGRHPHHRHQILFSDRLSAARLRFRNHDPWRHAISRGLLGLRPGAHCDRNKHLGKPQRDGPQRHGLGRHRHQPLRKHRVEQRLQR